MKRILIGILSALTIGILMIFAPQVVSSPQAQHVHVHDTTEKCRIGDFLCDHDRFHRVYEALELIIGRSCCHNSEGRPTLDVEDATPEQKALGFAYQAMVDGMWCGAKEESLMKISDNQKEQFMRFKRTNPDLFYSFMELDHVFAPPAQMVNGKLACPNIYCLYKKFPQG